MDDQATSAPSSVTEIFHIFGWVTRIYVIVIKFLFEFATNSPALYGYVLIVGGVGIRIYAGRRKFASEQRIEDDWDPRYSRMMMGSLTNRLLGLTQFVVIVLGLVVLFRVYLPGLFGVIFDMFTPG